MARSCLFLSFLISPSGAINDAGERDLGEYPLDLPASAEQGITLPCGDHTSQAIAAEVGGFSVDADRRAEGRWGDMIYGQMPSNALFILIEVRGQHLARRQLHVMGHGPGGIHTVDNHTIEGRAHVLGDEHVDFGGIADLQGGLHDGCSVRSGPPIPSLAIWVC